MSWWDVIKWTAVIGMVMVYFMMGAWTVVVRREVREVRESYSRFAEYQLGYNRGLEEALLGLGITIKEVRK